MKFTVFLFFAFLCSWSFRVNGQQIHYSQFFLSPHTTNPAEIGLFEGTARVGGIYRAQWLGDIQVDGFSTPSLYVDAPIIRGFRDIDWIGIGAGGYFDAAGLSPLKTTNINLGLTYHFSIDKDQESILSLAVQYGNTSKSVDPNLIFEEQITGTGALDLQSLVSDNVSYTEWGAGINWKQRMNDRMQLDLGFAMYAINEPGMNLIGGSDSLSNVIPRKSVTSGQFLIDINEKIDLEPMFIIQSIQADNEMLIGLNGYRKLNNGSSVQLGLGYRLQDAVVAYLGLMNDNYRLGLSYDFTVSDLADYAPVTFEIGGYYLIKKYKKPDLHPFIFCPRF